MRFLNAGVPVRGGHEPDVAGTATDHESVAKPAESARTRTLRRTRRIVREHDGGKQPVRAIERWPRSSGARLTSTGERIHVAATPSIHGRRENHSFVATVLHLSDRERSG